MTLLCGGLLAEGAHCRWQRRAAAADEARAALGGRAATGADLGALLQTLRIVNEVLRL